MSTLDCPLPNCDYSTGEKTEPVAIALLNAHMYIHAQPAQQQPVASVARKGPRLDRPSIEAGVSMETWNLFTRKWKIYQEGYSLNDNDGSRHLFQCADSTLGDALLKTDPDITSKTVTEVLATMKELAVIPIATGILRSELLEMKQNRDEAFRNFASRVRGKAETCEYEVEVRCSNSGCNQANKINFTDHIMRDVLLAGIYDADIRREMYGVDNILGQAINQVISLVEKKEMARDAHSPASASGISSLKKQQKNKVTYSTDQSKADGDRSKQGQCPHCKVSFALYREGRFGWNTKPYEMCRKCFHSKNSRKPADKTAQTALVTESETLDAGVIVSQVSAIGICSSKGSGSGTPDANKNHTHPCKGNIRMDHHIFSEGEWRRAKFLDHPTWTPEMSVRRKDYAAFSRPCPKVPNKINIVAKLDSCCQSCLWSKKEFLAAGFKEEDLIPVSLGLNAANKSPIKIDGAILVRLKVAVNKKEFTCATMVYISPSSDGFFMSLEAMLDLDLFRTFKSTECSCNAVTDESVKNTEPSQRPAQHSI